VQVLGIAKGFFYREPAAIQGNHFGGGLLAQRGRDAPALLQTKSRM
jgi:hypothetical protein